ncbi:pol, partial [Mucuna pruriens]
MEDEARHIRQQNRRMNPTILDMVKKEIYANPYFTCPFGTFAYTHMPFGLCNAPSIFQCCMTSIFSDLLQDCMKYHFMVTEGIVLSHLVSNRGIKVDKSKVDIITSLPNLTSMQKVRSFLGHARFYKRCILDAEITSIFQFCHAALGGGHYGSTQTARKVFDYWFYWPTIFRNAYQFVSTCKKCQKARMAITIRHEMPQQPIPFCEIFDVWGIDFMGPFLVSNGYSYILIVVDYLSRWVEAIVTKINDAKVVVDFLKSNIFYQFGVPKALISDQGNHFCNKAMSLLLHKYGMVHKFATTYHP